MAIYFTQNTNSIEDIEQMNKVIEKVNNSNATATVNISKLTDLNSKAEELSSNVQQALPINIELKENIKIGQPLIQEATSKNTELQASLEKTKEFIEGLDGSQNIPQIRLDVTELQNGLKSNQSLEYIGSSISADNTLEGRTESMKIKGKTMYKKQDGTYTDTWEEGVTLESLGEKEGNKISILSHGKNFFNINEFSEKINEKGELEFKADGNSRVANYMQIYTERNLNSNIIFNGYDSVGKEFTTVNQEKYYIWVGLHGDKKDNKAWGEIILPKNTTCYYSAINEKGDNFVKFKDIQIEVGTSKTQYEPYKCDKKDILIKKPLREGDYLYEDNGQVKVYRPTKQYTFTGDENFQKINVYGDVVRIDFACGDIKPLGYIISNNFAKGIIGKENLECINIHANSKYVQFQIKLNKLTSPDVEGFKAWLKANPTTIVYQLATPVVEVVENCVDIDLDTFGEKTYFNILNSLPGTLDFKVPSNIGSSLQNLAKEVNNIWDVINNLLVPSLIETNKNIAMATIKNNLK